MPAKYLQLASQLKNLIQQNQQKDFYENNSGAAYQLPTEAALCQMYHVSRQTVRKALSVLEEEHLIQKRQGSGSYAVPNLRQKGANQIAILVHSNTEYIYPRLLADLCGTLQKHGFSWTIYVTENQISKEREILQFLLENQETPVRGIVSEGCKTSFPTPNYDLYQRLMQRALRCCFSAEGTAIFPTFPLSKTTTTTAAIRWEYILHRWDTRKSAGFSIQMIYRAPNSVLGCCLLCGKRSFCRARNTSAVLTRASLPHCRNGRIPAFCPVLSRQLKAVTAIVCCNDEIAYWLVKELSYRNVRVPEDVSVVCFDCSYLSDLSAVQMTCYAQQTHELGTAAAESVISLMKGASVLPQNSPWQLVIKRSAAPPAI